MLRVGRRDAQLDALLRGLGTREAVMLTACNPHSHCLAPAANRRLMGRLREALRGRRIVPAESGSFRWREAQFLVAATRAWGVRLARRYRQNAILHLRRGQTPRLIVCA